MSDLPDIDPLGINSQLAPAQKKAELAEDQLQLDIRFLIGTPQGERFFHWFLKMSDLLGIYGQQNGGVYFHEGHRNCGKRVWYELCKVDPLKAAQLMVEITKFSKKEER